MSIRLISRVFDMDLPPGQKWVLVAICDCASDEGICYPGQEKIAKKTGLKLRAVRGHIKWLEAHGLLSRKRRQSKNSRQSDWYQINLDGYCQPANSAPFEHANYAHANSAPPNMQKTTCKPANSAPCYKEEPSVNRQIEPSVYCDGGADALPAPPFELMLLPDEKQKSAKPKTKSAAPNQANAVTWQAYRAAYLQAYGVEPLRNAKVNGQIASFVKLVGELKAPHIAAFYVAHPNHWYRTKGHDFGTLLANAQALATDWQRNTRTTSAEARQGEKTASNMQNAAALIAKYEREAQGIGV